MAYVHNAMTRPGELIVRNMKNGRSRQAMAAKLPHITVSDEFLKIVDRVREEQING